MKMVDDGQRHGDDYGRANIRKLKSDDQWETWKWQIELCLKELCLYEIVDGTRLCPAPPVLNDEPSESYKRWQRDNARAARIIGTALEEDAAMHVRKKTDAKEIWDTLLSVYEQSSLQRLYTLFDNFFEITKDDATSVVKHTSRLSNVFDDILLELQKKDPKATVPLSILHHRIFKTLGPEYQYYRSTWYRIPEIEQTTNLLKENLRSIESSLATQVPSQTASAFHAKSQSKNPNKSVINCSSSSEKKEKRTCNYCKKFGHIVANCRKRIAAEQRAVTANGAYHNNSNKNSYSSSKNNSKQGTFLATSLSVNTDFVSIDSWISDSGATNHMTANKQHFATFEKFPIPQPVETANKSCIFAYGSGSVNVDVCIGKKWSSATLIDVWYVPDVGRQLFSIRQATKHGNEVTYDSDGVTVRCDSKIVATGKLNGSVYVMNMHVRPPKLRVEANLATTEDKLQGWHERLGHQDKRHVRNVLSRYGISIKCSDTASFCDGCVLGKSHRKPFHTRQHRATSVGELINSDVNGPMSINSIIFSFRYYVVFKDDFSRYVRIFFMKEKSEVATHLETYLNECDTAGHKVKAFRSDGGGEFDCAGVREQLRKRGIKLNLTCPDTPEQNGVSEQSNRHVVELARSMLSVSELSKSFWAHACDTATFLINRTGKSSVPGKTPLELWSGKAFDSFNYLRIFGSECYVNIPKKFRAKFDDKAVFGYFVGYVNEKDGYKVWVPSKHRIMKSRNVDFRPEKLCTKHKSIELEFHSSKEVKHDDEDNRNICKEENEVASDEIHICEDEEPRTTDAAGFDNIQETSDSRPVRRNRQPVKFDDYEVGYHPHRQSNSQTNIALAYLIEAVQEDLEPTNFREAMKSRDSDKWLHAMEEEMEAFKETDTWDLVHLPPGKHVIDNRWVLRVKYKPDGVIDRFRARLVARGVFQRAELDYDETFSPVARYDSIRALIATAANENLVLGQFDVKSAFLYGKIDTEIYMTQPQGFDDGSNRVCRLKRSLYGLKQSPRCWNNRFHSFMEKNGFTRSTADPCIYIRQNESEKLIIAIYVDDGLIAGSTQDAVDSFLELLTSEFKITKGSLDSFLGMQIQQRESGFFLSQRAYVERILQRFKMANCNSAKTPVENQQSDKVNNGSLDGSIPYRSAVGSLMYLACATRPDIAYAVSKAARSMAEPTTLDWISVKRIFRYLRGTMDFGLHYTTAGDGLCAYSDADFAGDFNTRRSTNGFVSLIGGAAVSWTSQLQKSVALSTTEAEFVAASEGAKELVWLKRLLVEIKGSNDIPVLFIDNASAIKLTKNHEFHKRSKHIEVRYYYVRELYQKGEIDVEHVRSEEQLGDMFTKPLNFVKFKDMCTKIGLRK